MPAPFDLALVPALVIVLPAALAMVALVAPPRTLPALALFATLGTGSLVLLLVFHTAMHGSSELALGGWQRPLGIALRIDGFASLFLLMAALLIAAVMPYAAGAGDQPPPASRRAPHVLLALMLFLWAGANTMFLSSDLFNLYVALELTSLSAVAMVALAGTATALRAQMRYLLYAIAGSLFYLLGVALLYAEWGALDLRLIAGRIEATPPTLAAVGLISFGLLIKTAIWPLHFWLPPAHSSAPPPVSALLSALVVKTSLYLLVRLWLEVFPGLDTPAAWQLLGALGATAVLWGSVLALQQERLKLMIAYSTVAQLGYMMFVFPLAAPGSAAAPVVGPAAALLMVSHGIAKAAMFLAAGALAAAFGGDERWRLVGASRHAPLPIFALALAALSIMALPPSGGFLAKWLFLRAALDGGHWLLALVLLAGGLLSAAYVLRFLLPAFRPPPADAAGQGARTGLAGASAMALALFSLALGFAGEPAMRLAAAGLAPTLGGAQ